MPQSQTTRQLFFDGHNDVLLRLLDHADPVGDFINGDGQGHLDLPRIKSGGMCGGLFAIYIPSPAEFFSNPDIKSEHYVLPLPPPIPLDEAQSVAIRMASLLLRIANSSNGQVTICHNAADIRSAISSDSLAVVMHMEGAEAIDPDFAMLDVLYAAGLRSLGPVWSRPNLFGHGVPFAFPSSPDTGLGLSAEGKNLIRACNQRHIAIDVSHLNEKGFWDVAAISDSALIASHSNVHAISTHSRNLTEKQLHAIRERRGLVGINFAVQFIRQDGKIIAKTPLEEMLRHLDYLIDHVGVDCVGFGSDFDGATIPEEIADVSGLPRLADRMKRHGYDQNTMQKLCCDNWIRTLDLVWHG